MSNNNFDVGDSGVSVVIDIMVVAACYATSLYEKSFQGNKCHDMAICCWDTVTCHENMAQINLKPNSWQMLTDLCKGGGDLDFMDITAHEFNLALGCNCESCHKICKRENKIEQ